MHHYTSSLTLSHAEMVNLLSNGASHGSKVPESYIFPDDERPNDVITSTSIPVINLEEGSEDQVSQKIMKAAKEFGAFQVINHGIPEEVIDDMMKVGREFFEMPMEDKARYYSEDPKDNPRLFTGQGGVGAQEGSLYWRDCLIMFSHPVEKFQHRFPEKPVKFRDAVSKLTPEVKRLATRILKLISIGLRLEEDYLSGNRSDGPINMILNYYPPCPNPALTLGLSKHCDPNLVTLLLQGKVSGLQVVHDDKWVSVEPVPNAFVINFGLLLEVITNGLIKAVEHRAVTNPNVPRTSIALNMISTEDCMICPAPKLVNDQNPPIYGSFLYPDFFKIFLEKKHADKETMMENFRIKM